MHKFIMYISWIQIYESHDYDLVFYFFYFFRIYLMLKLTAESGIRDGET